MVVIIATSGLISFNLASRDLISSTLQIFPFTFKISDTSLPITFGLISKAPTTFPPFSKTYLIVYKDIFPHPI